MIYTKNGVKMKVSIIIPAYNAEKYIKKCLESVVNQTYKNIEVIVINDGSTDNTLEIIKKYKDIVLIDQENAGVSASRNSGIKKSTGDYIMFVDSDDYIDLDMVEKMINISNNGKTDIIRCGYIREYKDKSVPFKMVDKSIYVDDKNVVYNKFVKDYTLSSPCCQLIKKELIKKTFDESISMGEDYLFNLDIYTNASTFMFTNETYYHYLYNEESSTTSLKKDKIVKNCEDVLKVYTTLFEYIKIWDRLDLEKKVALRVIKELNMKLIKIFNTKEQVDKKREIINQFFDDEIVVEIRKKLSILDILKKLNIYTICNLYIYKNRKKLYYIFGSKIYKPIYLARRGNL